jgi:hypothetical protein
MCRDPAWLTPMTGVVGAVRGIGHPRHLTSTGNWRPASDPSIRSGELTGYCEQEIQKYPPHDQRPARPGAIGRKSPDSRTLVGIRRKEPRGKRAGTGPYFLICSA